MLIIRVLNSLADKKCVLETIRPFKLGLKAYQCYVHVGSLTRFTALVTSLLKLAST